ncbi:hypothetical protein LTS18_002230, partial [Coniosporium uncinatum]
MSLSLHVSAHPNNTLIVQPSSPPANGDLTFYLSELPDFTVHQIDERELPDRSLVKRGGSHQFKSCEDRFEQGNDALVKALQDVESEEPYWEDLRQVDLHEQALTSLHLLDLFCDRAEVVDVAGNAIAQLNGVPSTTRSLNAARNCLTSLTNWGHLMNLQYLDVSGNDIDNLRGFSCLIHLRELRADNNRIEGLDGIHQLDGLLSLSLCGNRLRVVDFEHTGLKRLTHLDMAENEVTAIHNLQQLPELTILNLDNNKLTEFPPDDLAIRPYSNLRTLKL